MSGVTWGIAARSLKLIPRLPSTFVPTMVMPIFFVIVFSNGFSGLSRLPGFPAAQTIDWFLAVSALMGAAFAGVTTGMGVARDMEIGFYDRFLSSPAPRRSLLAGALVAAVFRSLVPLSLVLVAGFIGGVNTPGGVAGVAMMVASGVGVALAAAAWSIGIALRFKTLQSAPLMQIGIFLAMFLSTAQMPLDLLGGWLEPVARFNPVTYVLGTARQGFLGSVNWADTWPGLVAIGGLFVLLLAFAWRGMRRVIP